MKKTLLFLFAAIAAFALAACEAPPAANTNTTTNTNVNSAKPVAAAPTSDALLAMDRQANEAWMKGDAKYFETNLHEKFVMHEMGQQMGKADLVKMIEGNKCDVKTWNLEDPQMAKIDNDTYVLSYKGTFDGSCTGPDGQSMKLPSPVRAASVYVRSGDKWMGAFHGETLMIDPKNPPPPPPPRVVEKRDPANKNAANVANTANTANTATANSNAAAPAKPAASSNTDALVRLHTEGWEAFKAKDSAKLSEKTIPGLAIVGPTGGWISGRDAVIKHWTEDLKCEGITKVSLTDGMATAWSPTVEVLTVKGTADGTCGGQKNGTLNQTAVYVKEGDAWKLAFMFESPAM